MRCYARGLIAVVCGVPCAAQSTIPVRSLTPAAQTDSGVIRTALSIRPLSDGRVLVNDNASRRVLLFDATLKKYAVVLDTVGANRYAVQLMDITPYLADSTLLLDLDAQAYVVISPAGAVARTMAPPIVGNAIALLGLWGSTPRAVDPNGRLLYSRGRSSPPRTTPIVNPRDSGKVTISVTHDSSVVLRVDFDTRHVDTVATFARPTSKSIEVNSGTGFTFGSATNPFPLPDEWTPLPDGTIAIVRGRDYHIDWVHPDGSRTSTPKMAFDWKRIPDEEEQRMTDSLRTAAEERYAKWPATTTLGGGPPRPIPRTPPIWFEPKDMEDYYPPIRTGTVKSDPEGNVWVLPTTSMLAGNGLVYDLVNRKGEVFERVRLPANRNLVAVGKSGVVYMSYTPARGVAYLERAVIVR